MASDHNVKSLGLDSYPRDFVGYGRHWPKFSWPDGKRLAISFVINYEEGGENSVLNGDVGSETYLNETPGGSSVIGARDINMETQYEYGSRVGVWRLLRMFDARGFKFTYYAVGRAIELNPEVGKAFVESGHEIASHGYRWINYQNVPEEVEREHVHKAVHAIKSSCGVAPVGWYTGRVSMNTRRIVLEEYKKMGIPLLYDCDAYNDDLPYYTNIAGHGNHLTIPYTLDVNDMKFSVPPGFSSTDGFFHYLKDAFDCLNQEAQAGIPRVLSIGLHCRLVGRPARAAALGRFLDYVQSKREDVWITTRRDIAKFWMEKFPPGPK